MSIKLGKFVLLAIVTMPTLFALQLVKGVKKDEEGSKKIPNWILKDDGFALAYP